MRSLLFFSLLLLFTCNTPTTQNQTDPSASFTKDLTALQAYFQIPGLSAMILQEDEVIYEEYLGKADMDKNKLVDSNTLYPIASLTKIFSGVLIMKLVEQGKLSLEDPMTKYLPESEFGDSVLIKHVLSHTSQGPVGQHFYYNYRFGFLTPIIEQVTGKPFEELLRKEIITPLGLKNTFFLKDSAQVAPIQGRMAQPYYLDEGIKNGHLEYGLSTAAGIISNPEDLAIFDRALNNNIIITAKSKEQLITPLLDHLPYAYGIFSQKHEGLQLNWAYGQYDCYSSLFLKVPEQKLTLILLANNNLMSDPARLIYGDAGTSLFVQSFLQHYIYKNSFSNIIPQVTDIDQSNTNLAKQLAQALSASFMSRFETSQYQVSIDLLKNVFQENPDILSYGDLNLMHNLSFLKTVSQYKELAYPEEFGQQLEKLGLHLLEKDPNNPYINYYLGNHYDAAGNIEQASSHFKAIVNAKNFARFWYTAEAENWLKSRSQ